MKPSSPEKPTYPVIQPAQAIVDTTQLFQKDAAPLFPGPKQHLFARLDRKKLAIIGTVLGLSVLLGGITYAQFRKPDIKHIGQQSAEEKAASTAADTQNGGNSQNPSEQTTPTDSNSSAPSGTTTQPTTGTPSGSSSGGASTTPPSSGGGGTQTVVKTYDISYTNSCYSPANVTIKKNDTVRFTNNSTKNMWPASDNHPSHTLYSEFDANSSIAPGGKYSFTYTKTGSWGYHDHLKPSCTGTITVQ